MVCDRCVMVVRDIFSRLDIAIQAITLGEVTLKDNISKEQLTELTKELEAVGFEVIDNKRSKTIEQIKNVIRDLVHHNENELKVNLSDYLSKKLNVDYSHLTSLFSKVEGMTIEKYYITQKIEYVKELLTSDNLSTGKIAHKLNYSSTAHLSNQFKKVTGFTPTYYKTLADKRRKPLDKV